MKTKIGLAVLFSFIISFSLMSSVSLSTFFDELYTREKNFYSKNFTEGLTIFIIGSSHSGRINTAYVNDIIGNIYPDSVVYNLSVLADNPKFRLRTLDNIISVKPDIVFYGISFVDFGYPELEKPILPEPKSFFSQMFFLENYDIFFKNPKLATLEHIRGIINNFNNSANSSNTSEENYMKNTPFHPYRSYMLKTNIIEPAINENNKREGWQGSLSSNQNWVALTKIISNLQANDIQVVVFTTPQSEVFLDRLSSKQKQSFEIILETLEDEYHITVYDFTNKYSKMDIWSDPTHVALNNDGLVYAHDIAKIILQELK